MASFQIQTAWFRPEELIDMTRSNQPAAGKAGIARLLTIEHRWPGLPEPGRYV
jgi:hypothetical protein